KRRPYTAVCHRPPQTPYRGPPREEVSFGFVAPVRGLRYVVRESLRAERLTPQVFPRQTTCRPFPSSRNRHTTCHRQHLRPPEPSSRSVRPCERVLGGVQRGPPIRPSADRS